MLCNLSHSFIVVIRSNMCINILKHFSPHINCVLLSPYLVKLYRPTFEMTDISQMLRLTVWG